MALHQPQQQPPPPDQEERPRATSSLTAADITDLELSADQHPRRQSDPPRYHQTSRVGTERLGFRSTPEEVQIRSQHTASSMADFNRRLELLRLRSHTDRRPQRASDLEASRQRLQASYSRATMPSHPLTEGRNTRLPELDKENMARRYGVVPRIPRPAQTSPQPSTSASRTQQPLPRNNIEESSDSSSSSAQQPGPKRARKTTTNDDDEDFVNPPRASQLTRSEARRRKRPQSLSAYL